MKEDKEEGRRRGVNHLLALHQETRNCMSFKEEQLAQPVNGGK